MVKADNAQVESLQRAGGGWRLGGAVGLVLALACLTAQSGCQSYFLDARDAVTDTLYLADPLTTLKESNAGKERVRALRYLEEPKERGGNQAQQDEVIEILAKAAVRDHEPLCRLQAIKTLGHYKDPRIVEVLEEAFYKAEKAFHPEIENLIQQQALASLAQTKQPNSRNLLISVARDRAKRTEYQSQQQYVDLRLAAIRGLGEYRDLADVTETLLQIMKTEKDVALRDRAHEALVSATGKYIEPDAQKWENFLHNDDRRNVADHRPGVLQLMGWWR